MAFVSMFLVMLIIFLVFLLGIGFTGLIIIIISVIRMKMRQKQGKKPRKAGLIIGIILFSIPIVLGLFLFITGAISSIDREIARSKYTCLTDEWRNEWVSDSEAKDAAIEALLKAADEGNAEAIKQMFPQNAQGTVLVAQIDAFFEEYPKGLSEEEREEQSGSAGNDYFSTRYEVVMNGVRYYICLQGCHQSDEHPEEVGITFFTVESEKAYVLDKKYDNTDYIFADTIVEEDFETRRIHGYPYLFTPIEREISQEEVLDTLRYERSLKSFIEKYGEPNVIRDYTNSNGTDYIYELQPENGEARYLKIDAVGDEIIIGLCYICGEERNYSLWLDDNGIPK